MKLTDDYWNRLHDEISQQIPKQILSLFLVKHQREIVQTKVLDRLDWITTPMWHNIARCAVLAVKVEIHEAWPKLPLPRLQLTNQNQEILNEYYENALILEAELLKLETIHKRERRLEPPRDSKFQSALERALQEPSLLEALTWLSVWEHERAHSSFVRTGGRETCFKYAFQKLLEQFDPNKPQILS